MMYGEKLWRESQPAYNYNPYDELDSVQCDELTSTHDFAFLPRTFDN